MKRTYILPYKMGSRSTVALSRALNALIIRRQGSKYQAAENDNIINWGNQKKVLDFDFTRNCVMPDNLHVYNPPDRVAFVSNKAKFFQAQKGHGNAELLPRFWTRAEDIPADAYPIVCRTKLTGHSGEGIVIVDGPDSLVPAPLYVEYVKKADEYRVHVGLLPGGRTSIIAVQRKARKLDVPNSEVNWQIRTHNNGFTYVRKDLETPTEVISAAEEVFKKTGLDFGAVDVVWNQSAKRAAVLEINTAPGLEGTTVTDYVEFFQARGL